MRVGAVLDLATQQNLHRERRWVERSVAGGGLGPGLPVGADTGLGDDRPGDRERGVGCAEVDLGVDQRAGLADATPRTEDEVDSVLQVVGRSRTGSLLADRRESWCENNKCVEEEPPGPQPLPVKVGGTLYES